MDCPFTISLVRHARTAGNNKKLYVGWTDEEIIPTKLAIIEEDVKRVYGSDLIRCRQSAAQYYPNANYLALAELRESNFGDYEMKSYEQLKENSHYRQWLDDAEHLSPPNGETLMELKTRVLKGLHKLPQATSWQIVSHGGPIRAILMQLSPKPSAFWDWQIGHEERYILNFPSFQHFKEGQRCTSLSVEPIMARKNI